MVDQHYAESQLQFGCLRLCATTFFAEKRASTMAEIAVTAG